MSGQTGSNRWLLAPKTIKVPEQGNLANKRAKLQTTI